MIGSINTFVTAFVLGLLTPTTAVCVLPLYPGFLAYLSNKVSQQKNPKRALAIFGLLITLGAILFMSLLGLVFTTFLQISLTNVIGIISPLAFGFLFIISVFLILNIDIGKIMPTIKTPVVNNPYLGALSYGFFFGAIVIPCNPLFIATLFTRTVNSSGFLVNILQFTTFGLGIGFPLIVFSLLSLTASRSIINLLVKYKRGINFIAGIIMLLISLYYLLFVFKVQALLF